LEEKQNTKRRKEVDKIKKKLCAKIIFKKVSYRKENTK
jgi:hypothetical protein